MTLATHVILPHSIDFGLGHAAETPETAEQGPRRVSADCRGFGFEGFVEGRSCCAGGSEGVVEVAEGEDVGDSRVASGFDAGGVLGWIVAEPCLFGLLERDSLVARVRIR